MIDLAAELPRFKREYLDSIRAVWRAVEKREGHSADYDDGGGRWVDEVGTATADLQWARINLRLAKAEVEKRRLMLARGGLH